MTKIAPIVLFCYNRLELLKKTISSLKKNKESKNSKLIIFSDGPKTQSDKKKIIKIRQYLSKIKGFKKVEVFYQKKNMGLANSIITSLNNIFKKYSSAIILEDDLVVSKNFLKYMNDGLNLFKKNKKIISIHGYSYPIHKNKDDPEYFFLKGADCWGWATWSKSWKIFEKNGLKLKNNILKKKLSIEFNFNNSFNYMKMLDDQIKGKNDSWAIRWYASAFLENKLTLYPKNSFVRNIGVDGSGTHGYELYNRFNTKKLNNKNYKNIKNENLKIKENLLMKKKFENYFLIYKSKLRVRNILNKLHVFFK
tara:strand:+ start:1816 stop:2739 length:924 start_codon:yes stop_codon:yes gene_type:complete